MREFYYVANKIVLPLKMFLTLTHCPPGWAHYDLYLIRDDDVVFYVGQSHNAFDRVWDHLRDGFKGRSTVGRFVLCNWPHALHFTVELLDSRVESLPPLDPPRQAPARCLRFPLS